MTDSRLRGRVKGLFAGPTADSELLEESAGPATPDSEAERQALQVLVLAQRTADEHISSAQHDAHKIRAEARARAEEVARDVQANAEGVRRDAEKVLADARSKAKQITREAQSGADAARREADKLLSDSRSKAQQITRDAQSKADGLAQEAQARFDEIVGSLEVERDALHQQIAELKQFDREYRMRLATFMQSQLRALGIDAQLAEMPLDELEDEGDDADVPGERGA